MFKFRLNGLSVEQAKLRIITKVQAIIKNPELLTQLGNTIVTDILFQTRRGVSASTGEKLKPITKKWVKERDKISKATPPGQAYSKARSNLTLSGQLLNSFKITKIVGASVTMEFTGNHVPYTAQYVKSYKRNGKTVTTNRQGLRTIGKKMLNKDLAEYVQKDRPFVGVRTKLIQTLKNIAIRFIRRKL